MKYVVEYKYVETIEVLVEAESEAEAEIKGLPHARLECTGTAGILIFNDIWEG